MAYWLYLLFTILAEVPCSTIKGEPHLKAVWQRRSVSPGPGFLMEVKLPIVRVESLFKVSPEEGTLKNNIRIPTF